MCKELFSVIQTQCVRMLEILYIEDDFSFLLNTREDLNFSVTGCVDLPNTNQKTTDFEDCTIQHFAKPVEALIGNKLVVGTLET